MVHTQQWAKIIQTREYDVIVRKGCNTDDNRFLLQLIAFDGHKELLMQYSFDSKEVRDSEFLDNVHLKERAEALISYFE